MPSVGGASKIQIFFQGPTSRVLLTHPDGSHRPFLPHLVIDKSAYWGFLLTRVLAYKEGILKLVFKVNISDMSKNTSTQEKYLLSERLFFFFFFFSFFLNCFWLNNIRVTLQTSFSPSHFPPILCSWSYNPSHRPSHRSSSLLSFSFPLLLPLHRTNSLVFVFVFFHSTKSVHWIPTICHVLF